MNIITKLDLELSSAIHGLSGGGLLDTVFLALSNARLFAMLFLAFFIYLVLTKNWKTLKSILLLIVIVGVTDALCFFVLKPWIGRIRPCHALDFYEAVGSCGGKYSHPSNHAANMMSASVFIFLNAPKKIAISFFILSILVGLSRVYLGVHYVGDIISGFFVGGLVSFLIYKIWTKALRLRQIEA